MCFNQLVPKSTHTLVNSYLFFVNLYPFWSTRTYFGQLFRAEVLRNEIVLNYLIRKEGRSFLSLN